MSRCKAKIRPFPHALELQCEGDTVDDDHLGEKHMADPKHTAVLRDYAHPGSKTSISWFEKDRRTFYGEFAPCTRTPGCTLPHIHTGGCVS